MQRRQLVCDCEMIHEEAVAQARAHMPPAADCGALADLFKMFADSTRIHILCALKSGEMCVCDLAALLNMTKSAISHQLKFLRLANLVKYRREGKVVYYSLADDHVHSILAQGFTHIHE